jgi:hypothetical protein
MPADALQRRLSEFVFCRRRQADAARPAADHVSVDHRPHPAQARAPARWSPTTSTP